MVPSAPLVIAPFKRKAAGGRLCLASVGKGTMCFGGLHLFLKIVNKKLKIVNKQLKNENKWRPPKHILALPTWGQKCVFLEL